MMAQDLDHLGIDLADNRRAGRCSELPMAQLERRADAIAVQTTALYEYDNDWVGYTLVGTSETCRRVLGLDAPIFAPISERAYDHDDGHIHLPQGIIGAQCDLIYTIGREYPSSGEKSFGLVHSRSL
ncbi:hypothetical protein [Ensifer sp. BR816]|uniref:hypothetical protein n=1 Tax=Rhizobium sp. (strain BR816) TaxID=1057002 RepID=UPI00036980DE|nr:hypothetical protein [Ensifer sp. BR816]